MRLDEFSLTQPLVFVSVSVISLVIRLVQAAQSPADCGGLVDIKGETSGFIVSPRHPFPYPDNSFCIWLLQSESRRRIRLTVPEVAGDSVYGACVDYLEVRDGSSEAELRLTTCNMTSPIIIESQSRWFWIKFISDGEYTNTGFRANWETFYSGETHKNEESPIQSCRSFQFQCSNYECISTSYVCDTTNDCGCTNGCDESDCSGLPLTRMEMIGIGISLGVVGFIIVMVVVITMDRHQHNSVWQKIASLRRRDGARNKLVR